MANLTPFLLDKSASALPWILTTLALPTWGQAAPVRQEDSLQSQLIARCSRAMEVGRLEGLVVVIQVGDTVLLERGWGRLPDSELAAPSSVFRAESLVEPLVAWTAMHLVEAGRLSEESTLHELLPVEFPNEPWAKRPVRVKHLMNHTSGLIGWASELPDGGGVSSKSLLKRIAELGLESDPGSCFGYSESGGLVLGAIVEKASGMPLRTAVQAHVLARLDLESTGWLAEEAPEEVGDFGASREVSGQLVDAPEGVHPFAEDEFCTTAVELTALLRALGRGNIVRTETLESMLDPRKLSGGAPIGVGFGLNFASIGEVDGFSIGGCAEGTTVHVAHYGAPDVTVTCLSAHPRATLIPLERDLVRLALGLPLPGQAKVLLPPEDALKVVGRYQVGCTTLEVVSEKGRLSLQSGGTSNRNLEYRGALQFVDRADNDARFEFVVPEGADRATVLRINDHGRYSEAVRVP